MFTPLTRRSWMKAALVTAAGAAGLGGVASAAETPEAAAKDATPFPFYAMDTGLRGPDVPTLESQVALLKKLGYTGVDFGLGGQLPKQLEQLDKHGLQLWAGYVTPSLE
ncbi:MAG: hypothetical protein NT049_00910, partial [Planctomycetota bacterium]|nr:hypothetical protein [Planctomycetota bacterium]